MNSTIERARPTMNTTVARARKTLVGRFAAAWSEHRAGEGAVLIAWQLLFSLFPLVVGMLSITPFDQAVPAIPTEACEADIFAD